MNAHQISEIKITPDVVDCIVFWTKNPLPMMKRLNEIRDYNYYFQFTLTGYGNDVEVNLPNKNRNDSGISRTVRKNWQAKSDLEI